MTDHGFHVTVMLKEAVDALEVKKDGIYVDCTMGGAGHSKEILNRLGKEGKLFAFDQDADAKMNLPDDERVVFVPHNFRHMERMLRLHGIQKVDGILADLGVSSHQFDEAERGFSIRYDAALDMRMDRRQSLTAADVLKEKTEEELHKIFEQYGEVTNSKTLAKTIVQYRSHASLQTIGQLKDALSSIIKGNPNRYLAQVFQALRIVVNDEFGSLREMLEQSVALLKPGGRVAVISFHSLEDRLIKNFFKSGSFLEMESDEIFGGKPESPLTLVNKKPILPSSDEVKKNPRSRSAKLRIAERK
ncbi:MAG: 16S rRNA (cytosine(1402)-N(4))-methyltransferase RsmH [Chitinophagaceae bacterium]